MAKRTVIHLGDIYQIPLPDGSFAYAQFIERHPSLGFLIRVFDRITTQPISDVTSLSSVGNLFPPVFVGLLATVRSGRWPKIGNLPVPAFEFPRFRSSLGTKPGTYDDWRIWDGTKSTLIGKLPLELRTLELEQVWGDEGLEERIVAGTYRGDQMW